MAKNLISPFFSVVMPVYALDRTHLSRSINSVLNQTFENWELIIVVDGSCQGIDQLDQLPTDQKIKIFYLDHRGVSAARNYAIDKASGEYICFLDGDDEYLAEHLQILKTEIDKLNDPVCLLRTGTVHNIKGKQYKTGLYNQKDWKSIAHFFLSIFYHLNSLSLHRSILKTYRFKENIPILEDTDLVIRIILNYPFIQINQYTVMVYAHSEQSTHKMYNDELFPETAHGVIDTICGIFKEGGSFLHEQLPKDFKNNLIAKKYLEYANGLLEVGRIVPSLNIFKQVNYFHGGFRHRLLYLKYLLKIPLFYIKTLSNK